MPTPQWILLGIAVGGILLTLALAASGVVRLRWPFGYIDRFEAFRRQPGEDARAQTRRGIKMFFGIALGTIGVLALSDAVMGGVVSQHALVRTPLARITYGASGALLAAIALTLSGRPGSRRWPRG